VAVELGLSEGAVKVAVHRIRRRYGELLRSEVARTLEHPAEVKEELQALFAALRT
jgi:RNA polymerase sigma-70 factor (ECF subfamily)